MIFAWTTFFKAVSLSAICIIIGIPLVQFPDAPANLLTGKSAIIPQVHGYFFVFMSRPAAQADRTSDLP